MKELLSTPATNNQIVDALNDFELRVGLMESLIADPPPEEYEPSDDELEKLVAAGLLEESDKSPASHAERIAALLDEGLEKSLHHLINVIRYSHDHDAVIQATRALADIYFTFTTVG